MTSPAPRTNPYVGPRAFAKSENLYGRDREVARLLNILLAERIVLLYSPSGAGKTSLIQAALIPALEQEGFRVLPVMRVGQTSPDDGLDGGRPNRYVYSAQHSSLLGDDAPPPAGTTLTLAEYLDQQSRPEDSAKNSVLIFDQFEEILTADPADLDAKSEFFSQVGVALRNRSRWALFAMREDFVAGLDPYVRRIPTLLETTFRLDLLKEEAALLAIERPAREQGVDFTAGAAKKLVDDLRRLQIQKPDGSTEEQLGPFVEPMQLQVVCYRLWERLPAGTAQIVETDVAAVGSVDVTLADYYADKVAAIAAETGVTERTIRDWCEHKLITESGIRGQVLLGSRESDGLANSAIELLEDAHLVRAERRRGATWYELAHDRLVAPVRANNTKWFSDHLSVVERQAELWDQQGRNKNLLLRDQAMTDAEPWIADHFAELTPIEKQFLADSQEAQARRLEARAQADETLRLQATADAERKRSQEQTEAAVKLRRLNRYLIGALIVTVFAGIAAILSLLYAGAVGTNAQVVSTQAGVSQATAAVASTEGIVKQATAAALTTQSSVLQANAAGVRKKALATTLAALSLSLRGSQPDLALLLSLESSRITDTFEARSSLLAGLASFDFRFITVMHGHPGIDPSLAFSSDSRLLAFGDGSNRILLWDNTLRRQLKPLITENNNQVYSLAFRPGGQILASGHAGGVIQWWDVGSGQPIRRLVPDNAVDAVARLAFSPDAATLAWGSFDGWLCNWDVSSLNSRLLNCSVQRQASRVSSLAFSQDGTLQAAGYDDGTVQLSGANIVRTLPLRERPQRAP